ncbi:hypothetical protein B0H16DRAFT_1679153 [Mycena metata]|uniref:C2H2-type domain-containing protein n=1 Tax=Mycena metata TaxID=1033252 RepID=A0AAD7H0A3_9AGAR|nr:hypothetical protein B0H16DRAFT_1679153 [Mycena metata]
MVHCPGCNTDFSSGKGLALHLKLTTAEACSAVFRAAENHVGNAPPALAAANPPPEPEPAVPERPEDHGLPHGETIFTGDFFGDDYTAGDFPNDSENESDEESDIDPVGEDYAAASRADLEDMFEVPRAPTIHPEDEDHPMPPAGPADSATHAAPTREARRAGRPIPSSQTLNSEEVYHSSLHGSSETNLYAPFNSKVDWEMARWAKLRGSGSTAFTDLLHIDGVREALDLSYGTSAQLNKIIDDKLPGRPKFVRSDIVVNGEVFHLYSRDIIECVRALWGDSTFAPYLFVAPERHYIDKDRTIRMYHNMHTGKWWWSTQELVEKDYPGATIVPIIISSDKTQLTVFGNKTAYPAYMTIGNIPKEIRRKPSRRGYVLLGYLPTSRMKNVKNKAARRRILGNVFHACMTHILAPLKDAGVTGIPMTSGDGVTRRGHPIYATFIGDYPEQVLVTAVKTGECPTCEVPRDKLGDDAEFPLRDLENILAALDTLDDGPAIYAQACADAGIKPVFHPFWEGLPYTNIFQAISPDILHQLYQGIVKHLISWLKECCGEAEIDARCRRLPPNHNIRLFMNGISNLSRVTGKEHDQISRFLLGIIIDVKLPNNLNSGRLLGAVRGVLDFLHLSQYPMHTTETLSHLENALQRFHDNKSIFVALGVRDDFNLPKLHYCRHYILYIKGFGTTDNYNTEYTERLHIDLAKDAYRSTNFKDEFPQMTLWLERKEKIHRHEKHIQWRLDGCPAPPVVDHLAPGIVYERQLKMTKHPTHKAIKMGRLITDYGAHIFRDALSRFITKFNHPLLTQRQVETESADISFAFNSIPVFHRIKFTTPDPYSARTSDFIVDSIHVQPSKLLKNGERVPARFDTALVNDSTGGMIGVNGYRVAQVRVVFSIPPRDIPNLFPSGLVPPQHLAYVEWFSPFTTPEPHHLMYKVKRSLRDGYRIASIIPLANIRRSVHLLPKFGPVAPSAWKSSTVLDDCPAFFVNNTTDRHIYATLF